MRVVMGWEGINLFLFRIRALNCGSWALCTHSLEVALPSLKLRSGARFTHDYDLNLPSGREVRVEAIVPCLESCQCRFLGQFTSTTGGNGR